VNIYQALQHIGVSIDETSSAQQIKCPFHSGGQETNPSARIYPATDSLFCFREHVTYTPISAIMAHYSCTYQEAAKICGLPTRAVRATVQTEMADLIRALSNYSISYRLQAFRDMDPILTQVARGMEPADDLARWKARWLPNISLLPTSK